MKKFEMEKKSGNAFSQSEAFQGSSGGLKKPKGVPLAKRFFTRWSRRCPVERLPMFFSDNRLQAIQRLSEGVEDSFVAGSYWPLAFGND